jgi:MOSC domain-containing protein YiiM/ferredoxin-NADP reductase
MRLVSVNVGLPKDVEWRGQRVHTGIWKSPVSGSVNVRRLNVEGDGQGDLEGHGGVNRAVFVYQTASYDFWSQQLKRADFTAGQFGENFTVDGLTDDEVRIGDRFRIGSTTFEVSQPRVTCYRVGIRLNDPQMPSRLVAAGRPGFYLRVLQEGQVQAGDVIELVHRNSASPTVTETDALLYRPDADRARIRQALEIDALSPGWRMSFQAMLDRPTGETGNAGLAPPGIAPGFRRARIMSLAPAAADVVSVVLESDDGSALDVANPGQFVVVKACAAGSPDIVRSYSICGAPNSRSYELGIKCEPKGLMGQFFAGRARVGDVVEISAPRGNFILRKSDRPVVLVSAGIGVTPVLAMLKELVLTNSARNVWWLYGARNGAQHPFASHVRSLLERLANGQRHIRYSQPADSDRLNSDYDSIGRLDAALVQQLAIAAESEFYLCGPSAFLSDLRTGLSKIGVSTEQIFSETFGSGSALTPGIAASPHPAPHPPPSLGSGEAVTFARTGLSTPWNPQYATLLEFAEACDVPTRWSCRVGVCHTCETGLISGAVAYDPSPLQPPATGNVLLCCATPQSAIVLDL